MLYLLDANVLIDADRDYYPMGRVPQFWDWLVDMGSQGQVRVPEEIYEEVTLPKPNSADPLVDWLIANRDVLLLAEQVSVDLVARVIDEGYANDLNDDEIEKIGRDPFLAAYALSDVSDRCIVTTERSRPSSQRANRKLPDVSAHFEIKCIDTFTMIRELDFRTS